MNYYLAKGLSINDVMQFLNPLPTSLRCLLLRLQHWRHKIINPLQPLNRDVIYGRSLNVSIKRQNIQTLYKCSLLTTVNRGLKLLFFLFTGNTENGSGVADELDRAPIDAFKEKKVTFQQNHKVFGEDEKGVIRCQFHQHVISSFYMRRSQKRKKTVKSSASLCTFRICAY